MRYRKLDSFGDYSFGQNQNDYYRDVPAAVGQAVQTRILLWLGEFFLNIDEGTPFLEGILGKKSQEQADSTIRARIVSTTGYVNTDSYVSQINPVTRLMTVQTTINTIYGPTKVQINNLTSF